MVVNLFGKRFTVKVNVLFDLWSVGQYNCRFTNIGDVYTRGWCLHQPHLLQQLLSPVGQWGHHSRQVKKTLRRSTTFVVTDNQAVTKLRRSLTLFQGLASPKLYWSANQRFLQILNLSEVINLTAMVGTLTTGLNPPIITYYKCYTDRHSDSPKYFFTLTDIE